MASEINYRFQVGDAAVLTSPGRDADIVTIRMRSVIKTFSGDWFCAYLIQEENGTEWIAGDAELREPTFPSPDAITAE